MRGSVSFIAVMLFGGILGRVLRMLVGLLCLLFPLLGPYFRACSRNAEARRAGGHAGLLCGAMRAEVCRENANFLRVVLSSGEGRVEEYIPRDAESLPALGVPLDAQALVFSDSPSFRRFTGLGGIYIPSLDRVISSSPYPFARRSEFRELSVRADMEVRANP
jgi:hypothetical protein